MNKICVIIPMFGQEEYTRMCIDLCIKQAGIVHFDILVVDDGSPVPFSYAGVNILRLEKNSGFTNATNQGILWAQERNYEFVHLLNNDTEPYSNFLKHLMDEMEKHENAGIMSSVRLHKAEGGKVFAELYGADLLRGFQMVVDINNLKDEVVECNWVPVCSSLIRMSMIRYLGLLNNRMRNHSSDLEYCLRAKINGFRIYIVTRSKVFHHHEVTTKAHNLQPDKDQMVLLEVLSGIYYAQFMKAMPLDGEQKTYGVLDFKVVQG